MEEPNWAKIIDYVYQEPEKVQHPILETNECLAKKKDLSQREVKESLGFLYRQNLISMEPTHETVSEDTESIEGIVSEMEQEIELTEKGFDVAHEREIAKREDDRNVSLVILTLVLAATSGIQALGPILSDKWHVVAAVAVLSVVLGSVINGDYSW